jgi:hypothetical protein
VGSSVLITNYVSVALATQERHYELFKRVLRKLVRPATIDIVASLA